MTYRSQPKMVLRKVVDRDEFSWQSPVIDKDLSIPPVSPIKGDRYIIGTGASGGWLGHDREITEYDGSQWLFYIPVKGWFTYVKDEDNPYYFNGTNWQIFSGGGGAHQAMQSIGTTDNPGTSSTSYILFPEMSVTMATEASKLLILFTATVIGDSKGTFSYFEVFVDGVGKAGSERLWVSPYAWWEGQIAITWLEDVAPETHTIEIRWKTNSWTEGYAKMRALEVIEL